MLCALAIVQEQECNGYVIATLNLEDLGTTVASFPGQSESGLGMRLERQYSVVKCTKYWVQNNADKVHVFYMYMYTKQ